MLFKKTIREIRNGFAIDEDGIYVNPELGIQITSTNRVLKDGKEVDVVKVLDRDSLVFDEEVVDRITFLGVVFSEHIPEHLYDEVLGNVDCFTDYYSSNRIVPENILIKHKLIDLYDSNKELVSYGLSRSEVRKIVKAPTNVFWNMLRPQNAGTIGWKGLYVRPHEPTEFVVTDIAIEHYSDAATTKGIWLLTHAEDQGVVYVSNSLVEVFEFFQDVLEPDDLAEVLTLEDVVIWATERADQVFHGYHIRSIAEILGVNVRFSTLFTIGDSLGEA